MVYTGGVFGIMENKMETTIVYWGNIGIMEKNMETTRSDVLYSSIYITGHKQRQLIEPLRSRPTRGSSSFVFIPQTFKPVKREHSCIRIVISCHASRSKSS